MSRFPHRPLGALFLATASLLASLSAAAADNDTAGNGLLGPGHWRVLASPYTLHWKMRSDHDRVWALGLERQRPDGWYGGGSFFSNSFGQPSAYVYLGKRWDGFFGQPKLFTAASGGILYGYREPYEDKVPFNHNGWSPGALLTVGWQFDAQRSMAIHALGSAGLMLQFAWDFR